MLALRPPSLPPTLSPSFLPLPPPSLLPPSLPPSLPSPPPSLPSPPLPSPGVMLKLSMSLHNQGVVEQEHIVLVPVSAPEATPFSSPLLPQVEVKRKGWAEVSGSGVEYRKCASGMCW